MGGDGAAGHPDAEALIRQCRRPGLPGVVPSGRHSLAALPGMLLAELGRGSRGVVVLAIDGLAYRVARRCWSPSWLGYLTSTVPSTSATAWLTALTGRGPREHGVPGMVYRVDDALVYAVTGEGIAGRQPPPGRAVRRLPTVFDRATAAGASCVALGRELDHLPGPWAPALLGGAARRPGPAASELPAQAADPLLLADAVVAGVAAVLAEPPGSPALVWVYVNLDDHVHANGYDRAALDSLRRLEQAATGWAADGWTVVAHSDHGQVPVRPDPALAAAFAEVDDPADCELPAGGAGRLRWLYPRPGREGAVLGRLAAALGDAAVVLAARDLPLPPSLSLPPERTGAVVAIAADDRFPLPDPALRYEHGGLDPDEMVIPLAVWRPPRR